MAKPKRLFDYFDVSCYMNNFTIVKNPEKELNKFYSQNYLKMSIDWMEDFEKFKSWALENNYSTNTGVCRCDRSIPYSAENCYLGSLKESDERLILFKERYIKLRDFCSCYGVPLRWMNEKFRKGLDPFDLLISYRNECKRIEQEKIRIKNDKELKKSNTSKARNITIQLRIDADIWSLILEKSSCEGIKPAKLIETKFKEQ